MPAQKKNRAAEADLIEWIIAAAGIVLIGSALGVLTYRALTEGQTPPDLEVVVESIVPSADRYRVDFKVTNKGSETAASVLIEGELSRDGASIEKSTATLGYAPAHSTRRGGMYFANEPKAGELQMRAAGYEKP